MYWVGVITAGMTAFYVFRAIFLAFFGDYRGKAHPHESPPVMLGPLVVLAALSLAGGYLFNVPEFLSPLFPLAKEPGDIGPVVVSVAFGLGGIALACLVLRRPAGLARSHRGHFQRPLQADLQQIFRGRNLRRDGGESGDRADRARCCGRAWMWRSSMAP